MALSPDSPRAARHEKLFKFFDVNRDGIIDEGDFASIEERCASFLPGAAPGFEEIAHSARLRLAQLRKVDTDRDSKLTEAEWKTWCEREYSGATLGPEADAFARNFFRSIDVSRDNAIDFGDYCYAHVMHGLNPSVQTLAAAFHTLDTNHSGKVNLVEFLAAFSRFVLSDDVDVPDLLVT